jgi:PKD repeat protein
VIYMSDEEKNEEKKSNVNTIRYIAIAVVAVIIALAVAYLLSLFVGSEINIPTINIPAIGIGTPIPPQASIRVDGSGETVYVYHEGRDPLDMNHLRITIGGQEVSQAHIQLTSGTSLFASGDSITVETRSYFRPGLLAVWYDEGESSSQLAVADLMPLPTPMPTPIPVPTFSVEPPTPAPTVQVTYAQPGVVQLWPLEKEITPVPTLNRPETLITFDVSTSSGEQPLAVEFKDTTDECVLDRFWEFGDGGTSIERFTVHRYIYPGTYVATLSVTFCNGRESSAAFQQIHVEPSKREDGYITGFKNATILPGGSLNFVVENNAVSIRVGGRLYTLHAKDAVQIDIISGGQGSITAINNVLIDVVLPQGVLYVNGEEIARGRISRTSPISYSNLAVSDMSLHVSRGTSAEINGLVNGYYVISPNTEFGYLLTNIGPDSTGKMILDAREQSFVLQAGIKRIEQITDN